MRYVCTADCYHGRYWGRGATMDESELLGEYDFIPKHFMALDAVPMDTGVQRDLGLSSDKRAVTVDDMRQYLESKGKKVPKEIAVPTLMARYKKAIEAEMAAVVGTKQPADFLK